MEPELKKTAIVYDFDGTLAPGNLPEHGLLEAIGVTNAESFWGAIHSLTEERDADEVLTYMGQLTEIAKQNRNPITRELLGHYGKDLPLFHGLNDWFERVNEYGKEVGLEIEHYVISSGLLEMIEACRIATKFTKIFACSYAYNGKGHAIWPACAINYTNKTQFLFRINKGILNTWNHREINKWQPHSQRPIPFERMIFIGDGDTDIPTMKMIRSKGGQAIAVFDPGKWHERAGQGKIQRLIAEDRIDYVAEADYRAGELLDVIVRGILGRFRHFDAPGRR